MEVLAAPRFQSLSPVPGPERDTLPCAGAAGGVAVVADQLHALAREAAASAGRMDQAEAVEFAAAVEGLSRTVEYLQLAAAQAVDTAHRQARDPLVHAPDLPVSVFDEYRNTAEFPRARLRISAADARRRLHQAAALRPCLGLTGQIVPPKHEHLAAEVAAGTVSCKAAGIILRALDHVRPLCPAELTDRMEQDLATTATENDQDFLQRTAQRWVTAIDQGGPEPSEDELRHRQGAFIRPRTRGMNHLDIYATDEQFEHLLTVMNTPTNPRISGNRDANSTGTERAPGQDRTAADSPGGDGSGGDGSMFERRTRPQQLLDGLVTACKAALASGGLPATGGHRPQVLVTIG